MSKLCCRGKVWQLMMTLSPLWQQEEEDRRWRPTRPAITARVSDWLWIEARSSAPPTPTARSRYKEERGDQLGDVMKDERFKGTTPYLLHRYYCGLRNCRLYKMPFFINQLFFRNCQVFSVLASPILVCHYNDTKVSDTQWIQVEQSPSDNKRQFPVCAGEMFD